MGDESLSSDLGITFTLTPPAGVALPEWVPEGYRTTGVEPPGWYAFGRVYVGGDFRWVPVLNGPFGWAVVAEAVP